jgi:hypothetical protein
LARTTADAEHLNVLCQNLHYALLRDNHVVNRDEHRAAAEHGSQTGYQTAVTHDSEPVDVLQPCFVEPMLVPGLIVGRAHERIADDVPSQHDTALVRVVGVCTLGQGTATHVVRHQERIRGVRLPTKWDTKCRVIRLNSLGHNRQRIAADALSWLS